MEPCFLPSECHMFSLVYAAFMFIVFVGGRLICRVSHDLHLGFDDYYDYYADYYYRRDGGVHELTKFSA
jgi:hypothetical protein